MFSNLSLEEYPPRARDVPLRHLHALREPHRLLRVEAHRAVPPAVRLPRGLQDRGATAQILIAPVIIVVVASLLIFIIIYIYLALHTFLRCSNAFGCIDKL